MKPTPKSKKSLKWLAPAIAAVVLAGLALLFSPELSDTDFWWHLRTGEFVWQTHSLPTPDPFAFTTAGAPAAYPQEARTRQFNLTHEWLAQAAMYGLYRVGGFTAVILVRVLLLMAFCGIAGWVVHRRSGGTYRALAAAALAGLAVYDFAVDRPYLATFLFVAILFALIDGGRRRAQWLIPPLMLVWANAHGGFLLGLALLGVWLVAARTPRVAAVVAVSAAAAWLNPNGFRVVPVLLDYRRSFLTSTLAEWHPPALWPPTLLTVLLVGAALTLLWRRRDVRLFDFLTFVLFAAAAVTAGRNVFLIGFLAPILLATYLPALRRRHVEDAALALAVVAMLAIGVVASGRTVPRWRVADWAFPAGAADFIQSHHITARMFNTYEYGGYLMWRLWPQQRVFIDGRALSEAVFRDYGRILYSGDGAAALLDSYGIDMIVMNTFEATGGVPYTLAPVLADAEDSPWKLVYADSAAVIFMRRPPDGVTVLDRSRVYTSMEQECGAHVEHEPQYPGCARALGMMYASTGEPAQARRWLSLYFEHHAGDDAEAKAAFERALGQ